MNPDFDIEKYYEQAADMFATQGWKNFIADAQYTIGLLNNVTDIKESKELFIRQGKLDVLAYIVTFEDTLKAQLENSRKEKEEDNDDENL